jgi:hypothetical protein
VPIALKSGSLDLLEPSGPVQACNGIALTLTDAGGACGVLLYSLEQDRKMFELKLYMLLFFIIYCK